METSENVSSGGQINGSVPTKTGTALSADIYFFTNYLH